MKKTYIIGSGFLHAVAATAYIGLVTFVIAHGNEWFVKEDNQLTAMAALMLFVLSAAVMGLLVFGRPVLWYIDGKKPESFWLLGSTVVFFFVLTVLAFVGLAAMK